MFRMLLLSVGRWSGDCGTGGGVVHFLLLLHAAGPSPLYLSSSSFTHSLTLPSFLHSLHSTAILTPILLWSQLSPIFRWLPFRISLYYNWLKIVVYWQSIYSSYLYSLEMYIVHTWHSILLSCWAINAAHKPSLINSHIPNSVFMMSTLSCFKHTNCSSPSLANIQYFYIYTWILHLYTTYWHWYQLAVISNNMSKFWFSSDCKDISININIHTNTKKIPLDK